MAYLDIEVKEDSAEKVAAIAGKPSKNYLKASEFNQVVEKINEIPASLDLKANQSTTYTKTEVDAKVSSTYKPQGSVTNYAALPTTGQLEGYVWNVIDTGDNYVWVLNLNNTGTPGWDKLSGNVDLSAITADLATKKSKPIIITAAKTAVNDEVYHNNGNNTFTDPTPVANKGFYVLNIAGSPTIGGNIYSAETYLFRYYNGTTWITNVIKNGTTQKDVVASRDYLPSDHNCLLKIKANVTLTIPASGLPDNFTLVARTFSGATLTNAKAVGVTTDAPSGLVLPPFKMQTLFKDAATNTYIISGELTT